MVGLKTGKEKIGIIKKQRADSLVKITQPILAILLLFLFTTPAFAISPITVAQSQIGLGEIGGNNYGVNVRKYLGGQEGLAWCAGFVSYCFKQAGIKLPYTLRAKDFLKFGHQVSTPKAGDVIVFTRKGGGHTGIVEKVDGNTITTIEGNLGNYPSVVKRVTYKGKPKNLVAYVRIEKGR